MTAPRTSFWRKIPRPRLSLRVLMLGILVFGGSFGWFVASVRRQSQAVAEITRLGGSVMYDDQHRDGVWLEHVPTPPLTEWLIDRLGINVVCSVTFVNISPEDEHPDQGPPPADDEERRQYSDSLATALAKFPRLEGLILTDPSFTDAHFASLAGRSRMREIIVEESSLTGEFLAHLKGMPYLRELSIAKVAVRDSDLAQIAGLTELKVLEFDAQHVTDAGLAHLANLTKLTKLELTNLGQGPIAITSAGLKHLAKLQRLTELTFHSTKIASLEPLGALGSLQSLSVANSSLDDRGLMVLSSGFAKLRTLELDGNPGITDEGLIPLSRLKALKLLKLSRTSIQGPGLVHLASLPGLNELELTNTAVTDQGLTAFQSGFARLESLSLAGNRAISDPGLAHLTNLKNLGSLGLEGTGVTGPGIDHLAALPRLWNLLLASAAITDEGLALIKTLPNMRTLNLEDTPISEAGLAPLLQVAQQPLNVWIHGTKTTPVGLAGLQALYPRINFEERSRDRFQ